MGGEGGGKGRNLNVPFTELLRTGQEAAKTEPFEARSARHYARQHAGPAGRNLTDLNLLELRANYVCSENSSLAGKISIQRSYCVSPLLHQDTRQLSISIHFLRIVRPIICSWRKNMSHTPDIREKQTVKGVEARNI